MGSLSWPAVSPLDPGDPEQAVTRRAEPIVIEAIWVRNFTWDSPGADRYQVHRPIPG